VRKVADENWHILNAHATEIVNFDNRILPVPLFSNVWL